MRLPLKLHPHSIDPGGIAIEVAAIRSERGTLLLNYAVTGTIAALTLPIVAEQGRADDLWRHSCFEAFVCVPPDGGYFEFNFAPSSRWAAYAFDGYRSGMTRAKVGPEKILTRRSTGSLAMNVTLDLAWLPNDVPWRLALSAVIEDTDGQLSYWALAFPPGAPDFHHPDGFALEIPGYPES